MGRRCKTRKDPDRVGSGGPPKGVFPELRPGHPPTGSNLQIHLRASPQKPSEFSQIFYGEPHDMKAFQRPPDSCRYD
jgi:hypothetical protein